uniref:Uncharacterized protein n=1 Tax=Klebsiella pneumoniae TaxID=573 RepID=A0A411KVP6_KLEPN|nr:hypothetical protein pKPB11_012 [Klebsiella pneumoniae]
MFIFLNTFKYVSAHETITMINASIILKKEEYEYSTFPLSFRSTERQTPNPSCSGLITSGRYT